MMKNFSNLRFSENYFSIFLAFCFVGYFFGLFIDVMEIDAAQYAAVSMEMLEKNSFLQVFIRSENYLDKPPLTFWLAALSFKIFGLNTWAYKIPSLVFALLSCFYVYRFSNRYYGEKTAQWATLILASCQGMFMMTHDCRTDTLLTGSVTMAIFHLSVFFEEKNNKDWILGFFAIGLAMLAKGPIGLVTPVFALGIQVVFKNQWSKLLRWQWIAGIILVAIMLLPMCVGLYQQHGVAGLEFYFWKQSFGRITGENDFLKTLSSSDYVNDPFFFYHTFLWAFLPWAIFSYAAFLRLIWAFFNKKVKDYPEWISWGGVIFTFIAMSLSQFKLPHYIFVCFPMVAVLTAHYVIQLAGQKEQKTLKAIHSIVPFVFLFIISYLIVVSFKRNVIPDSMLIVLGIFGVIWFSYAPSKWETSLKSLFLMVVFGNILLNAVVYPRLLEYQWGSQIGKIIKTNKIAENTTVFCYEHTFDLDFYSGRLLKHSNIGDEHWNNLKKNEYIILTKEELKHLEESAYSYEVVKEAPGFSVTLLTPEFLNPETRPSTLRPRILIKIIGKNEL
ncbi:MAG: glycosyltransferase family 39 protein [Cytophagales bacterium]